MEDDKGIVARFVIGKRFVSLFASSKSFFLPCKFEFVVIQSEELKKWLLKSIVFTNSLQFQSGGQLGQEY